MTFALVIDDNRQTAEALAQILQLWDIDARIALGPGAAMSILQSGVPDLVFLDINMPGVDGFEVLSYLRREPRLMNVPVVIVTSDDQPETAKRVQDGGANALVIKPVMPDTLETALQRIGVI
ncbi:MAG: response regulator [Anaerolineales bacterium]|nr:response regulator [Anaerolineales bacterium]